VTLEFVDFKSREFFKKMDKKQSEYRVIICSEKKIEKIAIDSYMFLVLHYPHFHKNYVCNFGI